jgi:ribonuclease H / adenosylcobalamin/alpha-ribazole phosphatase
MPEIVLVRHAATSWSGIRYCGRSDPPLSEAGHDQAVRLGGILGGVLPADARIISSPSLRALATAEAIAAAAGLGPIEVDERWREADVGVADGHTFDELAAIAPELVAALAGGALEIDWPEGETYRSLAERVGDAWDALLDRGRSAVVVSHAGPLAHARAIAHERAIHADDLLAPAGYVRVNIDPVGRIGSTMLRSRS